MAMAYKERIEAAVPESSKGSFTPLMTMYLTDNTTPEDVEEAKAQGVVAFKMYPAGATTNSDSGVTDWKKCVRTLKAMEEVRVSFRFFPPGGGGTILALRVLHHVSLFAFKCLFRNRATTYLHVVSFPFRGKSIPWVFYGESFPVL